MSKASALCITFATLTLSLLGTYDNVSAAAPTRFGLVDEVRLSHAASEPSEWFTGGRDAQGTYYSPLDQINSGNVARLGFAWEYRLGTYRGLEATPLVVDGVMYTSGQMGVVYALDAKTGGRIWTFDPEINLKYLRYACCDVVNRGVAVKNGVVYVGALDGRLFALDAASGKPKWSVDTLIDHEAPYTVTGAPQLTKDLVVIGNGGHDIVRGYVSAYDLDTGKFRWRIYTVPAMGEKNPAPELKTAAGTWDPNRDPRIRGGGTVWDGMAYDADLNLVYLGSGAATPFDRRVRRRGAFDNHYVASIIAVDAATGRMAWYYQTTPGGNWDYDASQKMILAELTLKGRRRKVIMQANKNGYFYVLDRKSGEVVSAKPLVHVNWTTGMGKHFRPSLNPQADYTRGLTLVYPSAVGAHSWQPMSYDPKTGLVYIPVFDAPEVIAARSNRTGARAADYAFNGYYSVPNREFDAQAEEAQLGGEFGRMPAFDPVDTKTGQSITRSVLKAWNPVTQKLVWEQTVSEDFESMEGGVTSTAGNLVFQGTSMGELRVYAADNGMLLRTIDTGTAMMGAPSTYVVDGVQYVAVMAGFGADAVGSPLPPKSAPARYDNEGRILVFRLGGSPNIPHTAERQTRPLPVPPPEEGSSADVAAGEVLFDRRCASCHGGGLLPDLTRMEGGVERLDTFKQIVLEGLLATGGMERFDDVLTPHDVEQIHAYLVGEARMRYDKQTLKRSW